MIPLRLAVSLGGAAAVLLGVHLFLNSVRNDARRECEQAHQQAALEAAHEQQRLTRIAQDKNAEVIRGLHQQLAREKSRSVANSELVNRLRIAIEEASGSAGSPDDPAAGFDAFAERAGVFGELLAESTGLLEEGRGKVAELAAKTTALQAFLESVCLARNER